MKIRTKISLLVTLLITAVIGGVAGDLIWVEQHRVRLEFSTRVDALMEGVLRFGRESLSSRDELMLLSYLRFLMNDYPEIELVTVSRQGHTSLLGSVRTQLFYKTLTITEKNAATFKAAHYVPPQKHLPAAANPDQIKRLPPSTFTIQIGFSKTVLDENIRRAQKALAANILGIAGIGLLLGIAGSLWLGRLLSQPITALASAAKSLGEGKLDTTVAAGGRDEIGDLAGQFNRMSANIRDLIRFKEDLLSTLSHELNTPLGGLKGFLEYLQDEHIAQAPRERAESYETMAEAVKQMEISLANALHLYKSDIKLPVHPESLNVNDIVDEVVKLFVPMAKSNEIALHAPDNAVPIRLWADKQLIRRVAINLISNAVKYTPPGGSVRIRLEEDEMDVKLSVADTGSGIAPQDQERIFTKFYRAPGHDGRPQRIPGSGLGLAIAKQAVDLQRGKIWVKSTPGAGSIFYVAIPKRRREHYEATA